MKTIGIYKITNLVDDKCYIGQSVNVASRLKSHMRVTNSGCRLLKGALVKYGVSNFKTELLIICNIDDLNYYEVACIKIYNSFGFNGYNLTSGGHGQHTRAGSTAKLVSAKQKQYWSNPENKSRSLSIVQSPEVKLKRRNSILEYWSDSTNRIKHAEYVSRRFESEEYRLRNLAALNVIRNDAAIENKRLQNTRAYWQVEDNKKLSLAKMASGRTAETELKRLKGMEDFWASEESKDARKAISKRMVFTMNDPITKPKMVAAMQSAITDEVVAKRTESIKNFWLTEDAVKHKEMYSLINKQNLSIAVICVELNKHFTSMSDAGRWLNSQGLTKSKCPASKIGLVCSGKRKSFCGYNWRLTNNSDYDTSR